MSFWEGLFKFLKETMPQFISGFLLGQKIEEDKETKTAKDLIEAQYAKKKLENELKNEKEFENKSSRNVISDELKKGGG